MKKITLVLHLLVLSLCFGFSQIKAVTEIGDTIYVYNNGTWRFSKDEAEELLEDEFSFMGMALDVDTIAEEKICPKTANNEAKSQFNFFKVKYNDKVWDRIPPGELNDVAEIAFKAKEKDIYAMIITEEIEIGDVNVFKIAINNMKEITKGDVKLLKTERRTINGTEVIRGLYELNLSGLNMIFDSYYFSSEKGTVQFTTWTGVNLWNKYESEIENLLNGFILL